MYYILQKKHFKFAADSKALTWSAEDDGSLGMLCTACGSGAA
jgi:hypothetical protein